MASNLSVIAEISPILSVILNKLKSELDIAQQCPDKLYQPKYEETFKYNNNSYLPFHSDNEESVFPETYAGFYQGLQNYLEEDKTSKPSHNSVSAMTGFLQAWYKHRIKSIEAYENRFSISSCHTLIGFVYNFVASKPLINLVIANCA